jgi:DNA-binding GntR family transcriptional regulator
MSESEPWQIPRNPRNSLQIDSEAGLWHITIPRNCYIVNNIDNTIGEELGSMKPRAVTTRDMTASQIAAALEDDIALGYLRPRERLVEEELADRFNVKRHFIRQALAELDAMGIVVRQPNRGAAVKDFSAAEVEDLWAVRTLVEGFAAKLIRLPAPAEVVADLKAIHAKHGAAAEKGDLRQVFRENVKFHKALYSACGNPVLEQLIEDLACKAHAVRGYGIIDPTLLETSRKEHARIIELLQKTERNALINLIKAHIQPSKEAYLRLTSHKRMPMIPRESRRSRARGFGAP